MRIRGLFISNFKLINRNYLATIFFCLLFLQNAFGQAFEATLDW